MAEPLALVRLQPVGRLIARELFSGIRPRRRLDTTRLWEVDAWRGLAVCMMVVYHLLWDLEDLAGYDIAARSGFWRYWQELTAGFFTLLAGVSLTLGSSRVGSSAQQRSGWRRQLARGIALVIWGLAISAVTYVVLGPERYVRFGILHLIGVSLVLASPLVRHPRLSLALGLLLLGAGPAVRELEPGFMWLVWLIPTPGAGVDQAPLVPMLGPVLLGVSLGRWLFPEGRRRWSIARASELRPLRFLRYLGQSSLLVYLVHQPVMVGLLLLVGIADWPLSAAE